MDGIRLDYRELRLISPKAARQAILQILKTNKGNVGKTARTFGVTKRTIYKTLKSLWIWISGADTFIWLSTQAENWISIS